MKIYLVTLASGDRVIAAEANPGRRTHSRKWDRCVKHVKASLRSRGEDPDLAFPICTKVLGRGSFRGGEGKHGHD